MYYEVYCRVIPYDADLHEKLIALEIECEVFKNPTLPISSMDYIIDESRLSSEQIRDIYPPVERYGPFPCEPMGMPPSYLAIPRPKYTESDRLSAKWLLISATTHKGEIANEETVMKRVCQYAKPGSCRMTFSHLVQREPVELKRTIKWGSRQAFSGGLIFNGLFCRNRTVELLQTSGLRGFQFNAVLSNKTKEPLPDVFQVVASEPLITNDYFVPLKGIIKKTCPVCGRERFDPIGERPYFGIQEALFPQDVDFLETDALFGFCDHLISQRAYRFMKDNDMLRGLSLTPLQSVT